MRARLTLQPPTLPTSLPSSFYPLPADDPLPDVRGDEEHGNSDLTIPPSACHHVRLGGLLVG